MLRKGRGRSHKRSNKGRSRSRSRGKHASEGKRVSSAGAIQNQVYSLSGGFPDRVRVRLNYFEKINVAGSIGTTYVFSGNNVFDPNVTGTGSQPYNYDDWAIQYNRYRVYGSTIAMNTIATGTTVATTQYYSLLAPRHTTTSVVGAMENAICAPYAKYRENYDVNTGYHYGSNVLKSSMTTMKFLGQTKSEFEGSDLNQALVSASPAHQWYWHTSIQALDSSSTITGYISAKITFDVEFYDRLEQSLDEMVDRAKLLKDNRLEYLKLKADALNRDDSKTSGSSTENKLAVEKMMQMSSQVDRNATIAATEHTPRFQLAPGSVTSARFGFTQAEQRRSELMSATDNWVKLQAKTTK